MSRRAWVLVITVVLAIHAGIAVLLAHMRALPKAPHSVPPPNFGFHEEVHENQVTGDKTVYREYTVSTKLAPVTPKPN